MNNCLCDGNYLTCRSAYAGSNLCIQTDEGSEVYQQYKEFMLPISDFVAKDKREETFLQKLELFNPGKSDNSFVLPTGGPYLFLKGINVFSDFGRLTVVFDGGHSSFRTSLHPTYKERAPKDETKLGIIDKFNEKSLKFSFKYIPQMLSNLGIVNFKVEGEEADDVLFFLSKHLVEVGSKVIDVSDDEDFLQFLNVGATIYRPRKEEMIDLSTFEEKYTFSPHYLPLYKSIVGDKGDNIPGVYRVGKVGATKIIKLLEEENTGKDVIESLIDSIRGLKKKNAAQKRVSENFKLIKRNLLLIDIARNSVAKDRSPKMIDLFHRAVRDSKPDVANIINTFRVLQYTSLTEILIKLNLLRNGL